MTVENTLSLIQAALEDMKATDIIALDVKNLTSITDYMVVCEGNSSRHTKAIANNLVEKLKTQGLRPLSLEGMSDGEWILVDFADVIVHIMLPQTRNFYNLEKLWGTGTPSSP